MRKSNKLMQAVMAGILLFTFSGCATNSVSSATNSSQNVSSENTNGSSTNSMAANPSTASGVTTLTQSVISKELKTKDYEVDYDENSSSMINLSNGEISFNGPGVSVDGKTVTINKAGTYVVSGNLENGQIIVDVDKTEDVRIVLNGVNIYNESSAAIYVRSADKLVMTLKEGSVNTLSGGSNYVNIDDNNIDGVIFSKDDLTINGNGQLNVTSNYKHAIVSKNDLNIVSGTFNIVSADQGLSGKDSVRIYGGVFNIKSNGQGIRSKNEEELEKGNIYIAGGNFEIESVQDAMNATGSIVIDDGVFNIKTGDDGMHADVETVINSGDINILESYEGIEGYRVIINGGNINISSSDDGINASNPNVTSNEPAGGRNLPQGNNSTDVTNTLNNNPAPPNDGMMKGAGGRGGSMMADENVYITINDGNIVIDANGDGIDSNGNMTINGGNILVSSKEGSGENALDYDGNITINGGILIGVGGSPMNQNLNESSTQPSISYNVSNGDMIELKDSSNNTIVSWKAPKSYSSVFITHPSLKLNEKYTLTSGGSSTEITLENLLTTNITRGSGGRGQKPQPGAFQPPTEPVVSQ